MSEGYLPGRLRIAAGTVNFNDSRVLASCLNDGADEIERLIARVRELEEACLYLYRTWAGEGDAETAVFGIRGDECETGAPPAIQAVMRELLARGGK